VNFQEHFLFEHAIKIGWHGQYWWRLVKPNVPIRFLVDPERTTEYVPKVANLTCSLIQLVRRFDLNTKFDQIDDVLRAAEQSVIDLVTGDWTGKLHMVQAAGWIGTVEDGEYVYRACLNAGREKE